LDLFLNLGRVAVSPSLEQAMVAENVIWSSSIGGNWDLAYLFLFFVTFDYRLDG
jgi:hypothetical protein